MAPRWKSLKANCPFCGGALQEAFLKKADLHIVRCTGQGCKSEWSHRDRARLLEVLGLKDPG